MANVTLDNAWFAPGGHYFFKTEAGTYVVIPDDLVPHLPPRSQVLNFDASVVTHVVVEAGENPAGYAIHGIVAPEAPKPVRQSYRLPTPAPTPAEVTAAFEEVVAPVVDALAVVLATPAEPEPPTVKLRRRVPAPV